MHPLIVCSVAILWKFVRIGWHQRLAITLKRVSLKSNWATTFALCVLSPQVSLDLSLTRSNPCSQTTKSINWLASTYSTKNVSEDGVLLAKRIFALTGTYKFTDVEESKSNVLQCSKEKVDLKQFKKNPWVSLFNNIDTIYIPNTPMI